MSDEPFVSYAQHGEDVILWRALGSRTNVFYVDVGAFHPSYDSVTKALYERGWRGINIEPQPDRIAAFEEERPEDVTEALAVGDHDGTAMLTIPENPGWASLLAGVPDAASGTRTVVEVPLRRLSTVLAEHSVEHVDVLKVDVEGGEPSVIRGLLDGPVRPVVCVIEGVAPGLGRSAGAEAVGLLVAAGYTHCLFDGLNHYLTLDPTLIDALSVPANPLDGFVTDLVDRLMTERVHQASAIARLVLENAALRSLPASRPSVHPAETTDARTTADTVPDSRGLAAAATTDARTTADTVPDSRGLAAAVPTAPPVRRAPSSPVVDPATRRARRRQVFLRILRGGGVLPLPRAAFAPSALGPDLDLLPTPEAVALLYRRILGRAPDEQGLSEWSTQIDAGAPLLTVARELARSDEARLRSEAKQARANSELAAWGSSIALDEIGAGDAGAMIFAPGHAAEEIFVRALYEVALRRRPSRAEVDIQVALLADGTSREAMFRGFAHHPDARAHLLGRKLRTPRSILRSLRDRRAYMATFRALVTAAEGRRIDRLLQHVAFGEAIKAMGTGRQEED